MGGDFFALHPLDADHYAFFVADVMGHGVAAALHTMHLSSLWGRYFHRLKKPSEFAGLVNRELCKIVKDESFATAVCGVLDAASKTVRFTSAGGPSLLLMNREGEAKILDLHGVPFGMFAGTRYDEMEYSCASGDCLMMFTDGAVEIQDAFGNLLKTDGLVDILKSLGYPGSGLMIESLLKAMLSFSNGIRLEDDLTLLEFRFS